MTVRIGTGAGYSGSRLAPAVELAREGNLDYLIFECLGERTVALAQLARRRDERAGFDPHLTSRMPGVLAECLPRGIGVVTNMGGANPIAAGEAIRAITIELGYPDARVAVVTGDDVLDRIAGSDLELDIGMAPRELGDRLVSANAYCGAAGIIAALAEGAEIVVTGRVADPSLFLGPLAYEFGWQLDDWEKIAAGTCVGHLLECSAQVTGGYFADPGYQDVPDLARVGFPLAEVTETGDAVITKVPGSGGLVSVQTCVQQLLYEVFDPAAYVTPDIVVDFSEVELTEVGKDEVAVRGARGSFAPSELKVSAGYLDGFIGEGEISYGGPGAVARARLAGEAVVTRLEDDDVALEDLNVSVMGVDSLYADQSAPADPAEARLRVAARTPSLADAQEIGRQVEALYATGPYGGGGVRRHTQECIAIASLLIPRDQVTFDVTHLN